MGKCKNTTRGGPDAQKGASPIPSPYRSEASDTGNAVHNLRDDVDLLEVRMSQMGIFSKMPLRLDVLLHPCQSDFWGRRRQPSPTFPHMEWLVDCRYVSRRYWREDYWRCGPCLRGNNTILWTMIIQWRAPLGKCQGYRIQLGGPHQLGQ